MDSFIIIEGIPLWVFLFFVVLIAVSVICLGCGYINEVRSHEETKWELAEKERELECMHCELSRTKEMLYKKNYKTPEVE